MQWTAGADSEYRRDSPGVMSRGEWTSIDSELDCVGVCPVPAITGQDVWKVERGVYWHTSVMRAVAGAGNMVGGRDETCLRRYWRTRLCWVFAVTEMECAPSRELNPHPGGTGCGNDARV